MTTLNTVNDVITEVRGQVGLITLNRPKALNALSLGMVRSLTAKLREWQGNPAVNAVAIRGTNKTGNFGGFCAGGDIRFFHQAALSGNPELEDFFTEEYALNYLIHNYGKPYIAFMDGIVMGGGMGISQGASHRLVTVNTKMAMPETNIGLFPDVGGGYFLGRCPGRTGEWLAMTGNVIDAKNAIEFGLADTVVDATRLQDAWDGLPEVDLSKNGALEKWIAAFPHDAHDIANANVNASDNPVAPDSRAQIDHYFGLDSVQAIVQALEADTGDWARHTAAMLRKRSPLMLHVVLEQVRRARSMTLADDLRMERDLVRHCFHSAHLQRSGASTETVEGIRALAVDKDHSPQWNPVRIEDVTPQMVAPFFVSPWPAYAHPLRRLG